MAAPATETVNPFDDPEPLANTTLSVGRNASLTLGTDTLVVLDEAFPDKQKNNVANCFGLLSNKDKTTRAIPYYHVLWAEVKDHDITITYADKYSKRKARPTSLNYPLESDQHTKAREWTEKLLDKAYGRGERRKRIKIYINPFGGQGAAQKYYTRDIEPILAAARCEIDVEATQYAGHAVDLAEKLDIDAWDVVACCSGDGVPHEVFNGLAKKPNASNALAKIAVVQFPCGSGNAMSINLNGTASPSLAAIAVVKGLRAPMDLVSVTQDNRRFLSFLSQTAGIVAEADLGTENLRWLGSARFEVGFLLRVLRGHVYYPADIAVAFETDSKSAIQERHRQASASASATFSRPELAENTPLPPLLHGTVSDPLPSTFTPLTPNPQLSTFYAGNMTYMASAAPFFPFALPTDGSIDVLTVPGSVSKFEAISSTMEIEKGTFYQRPYVGYSKVKAYRFVPRRIPHRVGAGGGDAGGAAGGVGADKGEGDGYVAIDGEKVPFRPFQAEVHRGLGTVLVRHDRGVYEKEEN